MSDAKGAGLGEASRRQLLALLEQVASVARGLRPTAGRLTGIGFLSALWLTFQIQSWTGASPLVAGLILLVLSLPALASGWLWWLLVDICELPEIAARAFGVIRPGSASTPAASAGVGEAFRMGGSLKQAAALAWEVESLRGVIVGVLVLANPLFLAVLGLSLVLTIFLAAVAAVTGLLVLLF